MPLVMIPAIQAPTVSLYIRIPKGAPPVRVRASAQPTADNAVGPLELWAAQARAQLCRATPFASLA